MKKRNLILILIVSLFLNITKASAETFGITERTTECVNACMHWDSAFYDNKFSSRDDCFSYFCTSDGKLKSNCHLSVNQTDNAIAQYLYTCDSNSSNDSSNNQNTWCSSISDSQRRTTCLNCIEDCSSRYSQETALNSCYTQCETNQGVSHAKDPAAAQEEWAQHYMGNYVKCGNSGPIPTAFPELTRALIRLVQILAPIVLIILGSIDFAKAVASSDADFLDKAKKKFVRRIIAAVAIFLVFTIVKLVIANISSDNDAVDCLECFINKASACDPAAYSSSSQSGTSSDSNSTGEKSNYSEHESSSSNTHGDTSGKF